MDGQEIGHLRAFSEFLKTLSPGPEVEAILLRGDAEVRLKVIVEAR
jgi:hypothetical protein